MIDIDLKPNSDNIVLLSVARKYFKGVQCEHKKIVVDPDLQDVECESCGEKLNPIAILMRFALEESRWTTENINRRELLKKMEEKKRCKCQHCGRMTGIGHV